MNTATDWKQFLYENLPSSHQILERVEQGFAPFGANATEWRRLTDEERAIVVLAWHLRPNGKVPAFANHTVSGLLNKVPADVGTKWLMQGYANQNKSI